MLHQASAFYYYWDTTENGYVTFEQTFTFFSGNKSGLYAATQIYFQQGSDGGGGYIGLQPRKDQLNSDAALFSYFGKSNTWHENCSGGADGGEGISCLVKFNWTEGRNYTLRVDKAGEYDNNTMTWVGNVVDVVDGTKLEIGSWNIPAGLLLGSTVQFMEWYGWSKTSCMQKLDYEFSNPVLTHEDGTKDRSHYNGVATAQYQDHCTNSTGIINATNEYFYILPDGNFRSVVGQYTPDTEGYFYYDVPAGASPSSVFSSSATLSTSTTSKTLSTSTTSKTQTQTPTLTATPAATTTSALDQLLNSLGLGNLIPGNNPFNFGNLFNW